jgi:hypothetical protein
MWGIIRFYKNGADLSWWHAAILRRYINTIEHWCSPRVDAEMYQGYSVMFMLCFVAMCLTNFIYVSELGSEIVTMVTNNKQRGVSMRTVWKIRITVANWCIRWKLLLAPYLLARQVTQKFCSKQAPVFYYLRLMNRCKFRVKVASSALDPSHWQIE